MRRQLLRLQGPSVPVRRPERESAAEGKGWCMFVCTSLQGNFANKSAERSPIWEVCILSRGFRQGPARTETSQAESCFALREEFILSPRGAVCLLIPSQFHPVSPSRESKDSLPTQPPPLHLSACLSPTALHGPTKPTGPHLLPSRNNPHQPARPPLAPVSHHQHQHPHSTTTTNTTHCHHGPSQD